MALTVVLENPLNYVTGAISTFVFTLSGSGQTFAELASYLKGHKVIGTSFGASNAADYASLTVNTETSKLVTTPNMSSRSISFVVYAIKQGGA